MKTEIPLSAAIGKTLAAIEISYSNAQCVLVFDDDTFTTLAAKICGDDAEIESDTLDRNSFGYDHLIRAGIMTEEEVAAIRAEKEARAQAFAEQRERETYERLKRKFG